MVTKEWKKFSGSKCLDFRLAAKLTQEELADRIVSSQSYIAKIEMGVKNPSADMLYRMAAAFGCVMEELFD